MERVENPVPRVLGVEFEVHETRRETLCGGELRKQPSAIARPVEVQVWRQLFGLLVENVQRTVQIVDKEAAAAGFVAQDAAARQLPRNEIGRRLVARHGQFGVVGDLERLWRALLDQCRSGKRGDADAQGGEYERSLHRLFILRVRMECFSLGELGKYFGAMSNSGGGVQLRLDRVTEARRRRTGLLRATARCHVWVSCRNVARTPA